MTPIETRYNGYRFRSRLEARWAVFFDVLGVEYFYEHEGYKLSSGVAYLPDFWLPVLQCYVEIKPETPSQEEEEKCRDLGEDSQKMVILAVGIPAYESHELRVYGWSTATGVPAYFAWCRRGDHLCIVHSTPSWSGWHCFHHEGDAHCGDRLPVSSLRLEDAIRRCRAERFGIFDQPSMHTTS